MHLQRPVLALSFFACVSAAAFGQTSELVLEYDAGVAGNPPFAPDPVTQGWFLGAGNGTTDLLDISPDGSTGLNAWQVSDFATSGASWAAYDGFLNGAQIAQASAQGWTLDVDARVLATGDQTSVYFEFAEGDTAQDERYLVYMRVVGLDVELRPWNGTPVLCPFAMDGAYHRFSIRKEAGFALAELLYDGVKVGTFAHVPSAFYAVQGGVAFGTGSSLGTGAANFNRVQFSILRPEIGQAFCTPANDNSSGAPAHILATGSAFVADNDVVLTARSLPPNQFGYFLNADSQGFTPNPGGSAGNLCLGGSIGRYVQAVASSGPFGEMSLELDLSHTPTPNGTVAIQAGQTWYFQCWFRDANPNPTSNFTDGVRISFL